MTWILLTMLAAGGEIAVFGPFTTQTACEQTGEIGRRELAAQGIQIVARCVQSREVRT